MQFFIDDEEPAPLADKVLVPMDDKGQPKYSAAQPEVVYIGIQGDE